MYNYPKKILRISLFLNIFKVVHPLLIEHIRPRVRTYRVLSYIFKEATIASAVEQNLV